MNGDLFGGRYSAEEVQRIMNINARPTLFRKPFAPLYKKSATENAPTWQEKREVTIISKILHNLIHPILVRSLPYQ